MLQKSIILALLTFDNLIRAFLKSSNFDKLHQYLRCKQKNVAISITSICLEYILHWVMTRSNGRKTYGMSATENTK